MNTKTFPAILGLAAASLAFGLGAKPVPPETPAIANKKPVLKVDISPVGDEKSPRVVSYADIVEPVEKSVVSVFSSKTVKQRVPMNPLFRQFYGGDPEQESKIEGLGSGVIVSADGYILTNNHVVQDADELKVSLADDREYQAKLIGADPKTDVAVIKIEADQLPAITMADSDKLRVGDVVFAVGNPLGIGQTVTMGIVSATGRKDLRLIEEGRGYENFIQTDAAINMGNSGGALVDAKGRLVGINTAIVSTSRGNIGIGFAIPANFTRSIMTSLIETGKVERGYLGVNGEDLKPELAESLGLAKDLKGFIITKILPNSPASKAGLKQEDVITAINDKPITTFLDLRLMIAQMLPGTKVGIKYLRDGNATTTEVVLEKNPDDPGAVKEIIPGVKLAKLTDELRKQYRIPDDVDGLVVTAAEANSDLPEGAVVVQINREPTTELEAANNAVRKGKRNTALVYFRGGFRFMPFTVK